MAEYCSVIRFVLVGLQDQALVLLLLFGQESGARCRLEDFANAVVRLCRAFEVLVGAYLFADFLTLLRCNWFLRCFGQLFNGLLVVSKVVLATDENDWEALAKVKHFGDPLLLDVVERIRRIDSEADEDDMRVGI